MNISASALDALEFRYQDRVTTPLGHAVVMGIDAAGHVWFNVDGDKAASFWSTCRTKKDFADRGFVRHEDVHGATASHIDTREFHNLKRVTHLGRDRTAVMQSSNGPCPIIALANALSLRGLLNQLDTLSDRQETISAGTLRKIVLNFILDNQLEPPRFCASSRSEGTLATLVLQPGFLAQLRDELRVSGEATLLRFYDGLNVSPTFDVVDGFGAEKDAALFALASCRMLHAWIMPTEMTSDDAIRTKTYDELIVATIDDSEPAVQAAAQAFLGEYSTQITPAGMAALANDLGEGEVAVMFQNNHFGTLTKIEQQVLRLVTDVAFTDLRAIVFEGISVSGGADFFDGDGKRISPLALQIIHAHRNKYTHRAIHFAIESVLDRGATATVESVLAELNTL